ncbi:MAG: rRNA maturation RNase YbeY [Verrucomicrobia bacterium]|nr:rRNA maturation RNase YbeY [Verrucomicrobiota bacterium]
MKVSVSNQQKNLKISTRAVKEIVLAVLALEKAEEWEDASIYFVTEKKICQLHDEFFQDPSPTDCISFPIGFDGTLGEVFVCPKTAVLYAEKNNLDPYEETALYIVHGLLHLLGYDDLEEKARRVMRKKEKSCMRRLSDLKISLRQP